MEMEVKIMKKKSRKTGVINVQMVSGGVKVLAVMSTVV